MTRRRAHHVGDKVKCERDEKLYPPRGSWKQYRGREGTVVQVNRTDQEVGVVFGATRSRPDGSLHGSDQVSWFKPHELTVLEQVVTCQHCGAVMVMVKTGLKDYTCPECGQTAGSA